MKKILLLLLGICGTANAGTITFFQGVSVSTINFVQSKSCGGVLSSACSFTNNVAAGNTILVGCTIGGGTNTTYNVFDNVGDTFTAVTTSILSPNAARINVFYAKNVAGGATTVTCADGTGTASWVQPSIHEYTGLDAGQVFDIAISSNPTTGNNTTSVVTGNMTTTFNNELVFAFAARTASAATAANGSLRENYVNNVFQMSEDAAVAAAGAYQSTFTTSSGPPFWVSIQAGFKQAKSIGRVTAQ